MMDKCIRQGVLEAWIVAGTQSKSCISTIWRSLRFVVPWLCCNLRWAVGDGQKIQVGLDAIKGMLGCHLLSTSLSNFLIQRKLNNLDNIGRGQLFPHSTNLWPHANELGILMHMEAEWETYRGNLCQSGISLSRWPGRLQWGGKIFNGCTAVVEAYD